MLILLITSFQRLAWFQADNLLVGGDLVPLLNPVAHLSSLIYAWNSANLGAPLVTAPRLFSPFYISEAFGQLSGLGNAVSEKILVVSTYSLAAASIFYIWPLLFQQIRWKSSAFAAALAYAYSPYLIADGIQTSVRFAVAYALVPFFLLLFIRGVLWKDTRYAFLIALLSPLTFSDFPGYETAGYVAILCVFFSIYHMISGRKIRFNVFFIALSSVLSALINMWWMLPIFSNLSTYTAALILTPGFYAVQAHSTITEVLRFLGKWSFYSSFSGVNYLPYSATYNDNPFSIGLSFGPIALALAALLVRPRNRPVLFCAWSAIISFFLTKGINPPLGYLYQSLLSIFRPFRVYSESFYLLQLATIPTSLMIGMTIGRFIESSRSDSGLKVTRRGRVALTRVGRHFVPLVMITIILGAGWPLLSNDVSANGFGGTSHGVKIPDSYSRLIEWIEQDPDLLTSKVLVLPQRGDYSAYTWGYFGGNLLYDALPNVVLGGDTVYLPTPDTQWAANLLYESFYDNSTSFPIILNMIGVKYIVLEKTFNTTFYGLPPLSVDLALLAHYGVVLEKDFGEVALYRNPNFTSAVYVPRSLLPFNYSIQQPGETVWQDTNITSDWTVEKWNSESTTFESDGGILHVGLGASGAYTSGSIIKQLSPPVTETRHIVLTFRTNAITSFTLEILGVNGTYYPSPVNSPTPGLSESVEWYTEAFDLTPSEGNPKAIRVWITNYNHRGYSGNLDLWIESISMVKYIGSTDDMIALLENTTTQEPLSFYSSTQGLPEPSDLLNAFKAGSSTILSVHREDPTSYSVVLRMEGPTLLVLSEAFSTSWTARVGGVNIQDHFRMNRFANGWLLNGNGSMIVTLEFSKQTIVWYGVGTSIVSAVFILVILVIFLRRRNSPSRLSSPSARAIIPVRSSQARPHLPT